MSTVTDQDLLSPELTEDPFAYYAELRATDPVHWAPASRAWPLTRYDDVVAAFGDPRLSSDRVRPLLDVLPAERRAEYGPMLEVISRWMVVTDPPCPHPAEQAGQPRVPPAAGQRDERVDRRAGERAARRLRCWPMTTTSWPASPTHSLAAVIARMMGVPQQDRASSSTGPTNWPWSPSAPGGDHGAGLGTPARWPGSGSCRTTWPGSSSGAAGSRART